MSAARRLRCADPAHEVRRLYRLLERVDEALRSMPPCTMSDLDARTRMTIVLNDRHGVVIPDGIPLGSVSDADLLDYWEDAAIKHRSAAEIAPS